MNERFLKLAQQTDVWCDQHFAGDDLYDLLWEEKFAELIVQECMDIVSDESEKVSDEWRCKDGKHIWWKIKEHFGVE